MIIFRNGRKAVLPVHWQAALPGSARAVWRQNQISGESFFTTLYCQLRGLTTMMNGGRVSLLAFALFFDFLAQII